MIAHFLLIPTNNLAMNKMNRIGFQKESNILVVLNIVFVFVIVFSPGDKSQPTARGWEDPSVTESWGQVPNTGHHSVLQMKVSLSKT